MGVRRLVVECVLEQIDSVLKFKLTLDFDGAQGNPALLRASPERKIAERAGWQIPADGTEIML